MGKVFSTKRDAAFTYSPPTEFVMYDNRRRDIFFRGHENYEKEREVNLLELSTSVPFAPIDINNPTGRVLCDIDKVLPVGLRSVLLTRFTARSQVSIGAGAEVPGHTGASVLAGRLTDGCHGQGKLRWYNTQLTAQYRRHTASPNDSSRSALYLHYIQGIKQTLLSKATYNKYICQKKQKLQYIAVGTVRMFIEPIAEHYQSLG